MSEEAVPLEPAETMVSLPKDTDLPAESIPAQNNAEQAPAQEGEKPPEEVTPEVAAKREGRRFERKLDKAYRQRAEAQARADFLEQQNRELMARSQPAQSQEGAPTLESCGFDAEKYAEAKTAFALKSHENARQAKERQTSEQQEQKRLLTKWEKAVARAEDKYEDFDQKVGTLAPTSAWSAALMDAENGEDIAHYLGTNIEEAKRIAGLPPLSQIREIGRLEAKLLAKPVEQKTPSKAPAPISPVGGKSGGSSEQPQDTDDINTWIKKENNRMKKQAGG